MENIRKVKEGGGKLRKVKGSNKKQVSFGQADQNCFIGLETNIANN